MLAAKASIRGRVQRLVSPDHLYIYKQLCSAPSACSAAPYLLCYALQRSSAKLHHVRALKIFVVFGLTIALTLSAPFLTRSDSASLPEACGQSPELLSGLASALGAGQGLTCSRSFVLEAAIPH